MVSAYFLNALIDWKLRLSANVEPKANSWNGETTSRFCPFKRLSLVICARTYDQTFSRTTGIIWLTKGHFFFYRNTVKNLNFYKMLNIFIKYITNRQFEPKLSFLSTSFLLMCWSVWFMVETKIFRKFLRKYLRYFQLVTFPTGYL